MNNRILTLLLVFLFVASPLCASEMEHNKHQKMDQASTPSTDDSAHQHHEQPAQVGVDEQLGGKMNLDLHFVDETGTPVLLSDIIDKPTIIAPIYYRCPNVCNFLQAGLAQALPGVELEPGVDYQVLSISFDDTDTPQAAKGSKGTYYTAMGRPYPEQAWRFLTGNQDNIDRFLNGIGYSVERKGEDFLHPVAVVIVGPDGKVSRYLYGTRFLPKDLTLGLIEASEGRVGTAIQRALSICFSYDPAGKKYVFNLLQVAATVVLLTAGGLFAFLMFTGRRKPVAKDTKSTENENSQDP